MLWVYDNIALMEDPRWLRVIIIGLVLAALAIGYFLFSGRFLSNNATKVGQQESQQIPAVSASPASSVLGENTQVSPKPSPTSAFDRIVERNKGGVQTLPKTAFPAGLALVFSVSAIVSGWSLRKIPH